MRRQTRLSQSDDVAKNSRRKVQNVVTDGSSMTCCSRPPDPYEPPPNPFSSSWAAGLGEDLGGMNQGMAIRLVPNR